MTRDSIIIELETMRANVAFPQPVILSVEAGFTYGNPQRYETRWDYSPADKERRIKLIKEFRRLKGVLE